MDIVADNLLDIGRYAKSLIEKLGRTAEVSRTTSLEAALDGAQFVVSAVELGRSLYWAQDFHIPRKYGFRQVFAENGGPGSLFHGLRAMKAMVPIARAMERICPDAIVLNYTNPMHKVCDAIATLSRPDASGSATACGWEWSRSPISSTSLSMRWRWRPAASIPSVRFRPSTIPQRA